MTTATDTPRTDAEVFEIQDCNGQLRKVITTQFAKQLERELAHSLENQVKSAENAEDDLIRTQIEMQLEIDKAEAEVERLKEQLKRAVEIADKIWAACSNGSEHTEIAALKGKIK